MENGLKAALLIAALSAGAPAASAQEAANPAARTHVKIVNGVPLKHTSRLAQVVELNFTLGFTHTDGKKVISQALDRIARSYALGGKDAFTLRKFTTGNGGSVSEEMANFTLADLTAGEVIVTNNISDFNELQAKNAAQAAAFEAAVKTEGRGVLSFHGSGDGGAGWRFYTEDFHPVGYNNHGSRIPGTVYKFTDKARHVILQGILETGTTAASVPMKVDASGNEVIESGVKTRRMLNEWYKFARNLTDDAKYAPLVTPLLKYDPRDLAAALETRYRYKGGNLYTFLLKVGNGRVSYIPAGHGNDELMEAGTTFDGGTGDFDRYVAQTLFFLAGYKTEVCAGAACDGLPIVGADDQVTGQKWPPPVAVQEFGRPAFTVEADGDWEARLTDVTGRLVARRSGRGKTAQAFDGGNLEAGIYYVALKVGSGPARVRRYAVAGAR